MAKVASKYLFIIIDEIIEDLKSKNSAQITRSINRIVGLRNISSKSLKHRDTRYDNMYREYVRIINRFYDNDIPGTITMLRELQDEVATNYEDIEDKYRSAWWRFADWRKESFGPRQEKDLYSNSN